MPKNSVRKNPLFNSVNLPLTFAVLMLLFIFPLSTIMIGFKTSFLPKAKELEIYQQAPDLSRKSPIVDMYCRDLPVVKFGIYPENDNGGVFGFNEDGVISVPVRENPSTGYTWRFSVDPHDIPGSTALVEGLCYREISTECNQADDCACGKRKEGQQCDVGRKEEIVEGSADQCQDLCFYNGQPDQLSCDDNFCNLVNKPIQL